MKIHIHIDQTKLANPLHFATQLNNKPIVYRNKKAYTRKQKHKVRYF